MAGDFEAAYQSALRLGAGYRDLQLEAASLRFRLNFGTVVCENCEGLRAGLGVVATCYQIRRCEYRNIREGDAEPRHLEVIRRLTSK